MEPRDILNYVVNQPEVLRNVAPGFDSVDISAFLEKPRNVMLGDEHGVLIFGYIGEDVYEMHYLFTSAVRGRDALHFTRAALKYMFTCASAIAIVGQTPRDNRAARVMNRALGARPIGESVDTSGRPCINYMLERKTWAVSSAES